jgi:hypothetical protein
MLCYSQSILVELNKKNENILVILIFLILINLISLYYIQYMII